MTDVNREIIDGINKRVKCDSCHYKVTLEDEPTETRYIKTCVVCNDTKVYKTPKPISNSHRFPT